MKSVKIVFGILAAVLLMVACTNNVDFKKTSGGIPYKIFSGSGKGDSVQKDYIVKYHVIQKVGDSVIYSTYRNNFAQYVAIQPPPMKLEYSDIQSNVLELLTKTKAGDSIYLVQSTDSIIKKDTMNMMKLKKGQEIVTTIRVAQVFKTEAEARAQFMKDREVAIQQQIKDNESKDKDELAAFKKDTAKQAQVQKDNKAIEDYLKAKNIQAEKTDWGVYVQMLAPGEGPKPAPGKFANVKYRGTTLQGVEFDKGVYPVQIGAHGAIRGFEEGVRMLSKGGKALIFIPSPQPLAYGPMPNGDKIGPNSILVFELELLDITDTMPQPMMPQGQ